MKSMGANAWLAISNKITGIAFKFCDSPSYGDCCQEAEFSMNVRLKAHLIGRNESVFETLFNQFHDPKMVALNIKIDDGCPEHRQVLVSLGFLIES